MLILIFIRFYFIIFIFLKNVKLDSFKIVSDFSENDFGGTNEPLEFDVDHIFEPGRIAGCTLYSEINNTVFYMIASTKSSIRCSEIWEFSLDLKQWAYRKGKCNSLVKFHTFGKYNSSNDVGGRFGPTCFFSTGKKTIYETTGYGKLLPSPGTPKLLSDLWEYSINQNQWRILKNHSDSGNYIDKGFFSPVAQFGGRYSSALWIYNETAFIFSGCKTVGSYYYNDMWAIRISDLYFKWVHGPETPNSHTVTEKNVYNTTFIPRGRRWESNWVNEKKGLLYLYGGYNSINNKEYFNDLIVFSVNKTSWKWLGGSITSINEPIVIDSKNFTDLNWPGGIRSAHLFQYSDNFIYLYGGYFNFNGSIGTTDNIWLYNVELNQFKHIDGSDERSPVKTLTYIGGRGYAGFAKINQNQFIIIAGYTSIFDNDVWIYTVSRCGSNFYHEDPENLCSGRGNCVKSTITPNYYYCQCNNETLTGTDCETYTEPFNYLLLVIGIVSIIVASVLICLTISLILFFSGLKWFLNLYEGQKKFAKIKDVDKILIDQQKDEESDVSFKINKKLFEIKYENIKLIKEINSGGSDSVIYKASWNGKEVAVKLFKVRTFTNQNNYKEFEREVSILGSISHPNILNFYGATLNLPKLGIVMELCEGELREDIKMGNFTMESKINICKGIIAGMEYLHNRDIIHRDLKSSNILMDKYTNPKIIDFGLSRIIDTNKSKNMTVRVGTACYMSPEIALGGKYDQRTDVYSFGIILWEIMHDNVHPYGKNVSFNIEAKVATDSEFRPMINPAKFTKGTKFLINVIRQCWVHELEDRPQFGEIREMFDRVRVGKGKQQNRSRTSYKNNDGYDDHYDDMY